MPRRKPPPEPAPASLLSCKYCDGFIGELVEALDQRERDKQRIRELEDQLLDAGNLTRELYDNLQYVLKQGQEALDYIGYANRRMRRLQAAVRHLEARTRKRDSLFDVHGKRLHDLRTNRIHYRQGKPRPWDEIAAIVRAEGWCITAVAARQHYGRWLAERRGKPSV